MSAKRKTEGFSTLSEHEKIALVSAKTIPPAPADDYQKKTTFDTRDSTIDCIINSCTEELEDIRREYIAESDRFRVRQLQIIMTKLPMYMPDSLVRPYAEYAVKTGEAFDKTASADAFVYTSLKVFRLNDGKFFPERRLQSQPQ